MINKIMRLKKKYPYNATSEQEVVISAYNQAIEDVVSFIEQFEVGYDLKTMSRIISKIRNLPPLGSGQALKDILIEDLTREYSETTGVNIPNLSSDEKNSISQLSKEEE